MAMSSPVLPPLQCGGMGAWSEAATARFSELVHAEGGVAIAKGKVLEVEGHFCTLTLYVRYAYVSSSL